VNRFHKAKTTVRFQRKDTNELPTEVLFAKKNEQEKDASHYFFEF
jgi:hypothetical protein